MSIGPMGFFGSVAATPAAQGAGEAERAKGESSRRQGEVKNAQSAESAAGVGKTDGEQHETEERDADGRRLWEGGEAAAPAQQAAVTETPRQSVDPSGESGGALDLTG